MKRRTLVALASAAVLAGTPGAARAVSVQIASQGTFALQGAATHVNAQMIASALASPLGWEMQFTFAHTGARIAIAEYLHADTTPMQLIVVDDAMQSFVYLHPRLDPAGTFHQRVTFPKSGFYHLYADTTPSGSARQVFRFDFVGGSLSDRPPPRNLTPSPSGAVRVAAGPYRVLFTVPPLRSGTRAIIGVQIARGGVAANAFMLSAKDLTYVAVGRETTGPGAIRLSITPHVRGAYKLWLQVAGSDGSTYVAPIAVAVR